MDAPDRFEAEDRADFEQVLRLALDTPEICEALRRPGIRSDAERLRSQARAATETISAAAAAEYIAYLRLRATVGPSAAHRLERPHDGDTSTAGRGLPAALAVLAPVLSATASAILLLLGYGLQLTATQQHLADALVGTGWITATLAALASLIAAATLIVTAVRHRSSPGGHPHQDAPTVVEARAVWRQALLARGMLPFLRLQLHLAAPAPDTEAQPSSPRSSGAVPLQQRRARLD
ncbi:hypothetical protein [Streptomyces sp.]|uniref:hypothetical protein n=1 Tax=Streptomyces sp. TaxID=1931 RepID=UPI002D785D33|nr:hypothetical protein [Streptomyces sp.]HET6358139.1 hypothetical protein [Streptomyces sp.]